MILALDVGNSQIFGGVFEDGALTIRFRKPSKLPTSSDELGLFLRGVLRENGGDPAAVRQITLCSVVPEIIYSLRSCCRKYFAIDPFILQAGVKTGLKIGYRNPLEVGADRIANAIAATHRYPIATSSSSTSERRPRSTSCAPAGSSSAASSCRAFESRWKRSRRTPPGCPTWRSFPPPSSSAARRSNASSPGLYFGNRAALDGLTRQIREHVFPGQTALVIATGGFSRLFEGDRLFDVLDPDLVLVGLERALALNPNTGATRASYAHAGG